MFHYRSLLPLAAPSFRMMRFASIWRRENTECDRKLSNETQIQSALFGIESDTIGSLQKIALDPIISKLLDEIPDEPPRSKLEVHADVIATQRPKRRTYCEIAEFFREHLAITVAPSITHDFCPRPPTAGKTKGCLQWPANSCFFAARKRISLADDDVRRRIAALKRRTPVERSVPRIGEQKALVDAIRSRHTGGSATQ